MCPQSTHWNQLIVYICYLNTNQLIDGLSHFLTHVLKSIESEIKTKTDVNNENKIRFQMNSNLVLSIFQMPVPIVL